MKRAFTGREKVLLAVFILLLVFVGYFKLILEPINARVAQYQIDAATEQDIMVAQADTLADKKRMEKELEEIRASKDFKEIPEYDNIRNVIKEMDAILQSNSADYSLYFKELVETDSVVRRAIVMDYKTETYQKARTIVNSLHGCKYPNQISDLSYTYLDDESGNQGQTVEVDLTVTFYELAY
ncbi:MAG TPA: hypothetical protein PKI76_07935 [Oscillospiraceae bacterium]|nr:hypothetical protein [Oscillospiraceae bacterium]HNW05290.1 hypothetical protein [Oscillospiraceae bacterium]